MDPIDPIKQLLLVAEKYARVTRVPLSVASSQVLGDSRALPRIKLGGGITVRNFWRALNTFSKLWPEGQAWPAEVARPTARRSRPAATRARRRAA